ncbi:MAG: MoaD/ThiS family protein [Pseudomonadota bacterium]
MNILLFAQLRDYYGASSVTFPDDELPLTVDELRSSLAGLGSEEFRQALLEPNVFCAVNQKVVEPKYIVQADDEVGFFPPMTGG